MPEPETPRQDTAGSVQEELSQRMIALDLMNRAAVIANEATDFPQAMAEVVTAVCVSLGWKVGHVYEVSTTDQLSLNPSSIWYLEDPEAFTSFYDATMVTPLQPGIGLPGRVYATRAPLWIEHLSSDPNFPRAGVADDLGVHSGVGFPVIAHNEVIAVLEFFSDSLRQPEAFLAEVMNHLAVQLAHVAERELASEALRQSEKQARLVIETANDAFVGIDAESIIIDWNNQATTLFGWQRSEALGRPLVETIIPPHLRDAHTAGLKHFMDTGEGPVLFNRIEVPAVNKAGEEFPIELTIWPIATANGFVFNAFMRDVTARKNLEAQLAQSQKMEAIGQLAGGVAHDFNNLLSVIQSHAHFIREETGETVVKQDAIEIITACERAAGVTRQLLRMSRSEVANPEVQDINDIVAETIGLLARALPATISVVVIPQDDPWFARVDAGQLGQVIMNLAVNSRDAMPDGGSLVVRTENVFVDEETIRHLPGLTEGEYVRLSVTDEGQGMDEALRAKIFDPFFTTKPREQGTGLGLATVYGIVKQAGGYIFVDSAIGVGTTFSVYLPRVPSEIAVEPIPPIPTPLNGGALVLLVEDQEAVRRVVRRMLEKNGYAVVESADPINALALARELEHVDLLLTDVILPEMTGRDLAIHVAALHDELKVLYMSGYTNMLIAEAGVLTSEESFIQKPFSETALLEALDRSLGRDREVDGTLAGS